MIYKITEGEAGRCGINYMRPNSSTVFCLKIIVPLFFWKTDYLDFMSDTVYNGRILQVFVFRIRRRRYRPNMNWKLWLFGCRLYRRAMGKRTIVMCREYAEDNNISLKGYVTV